MAGNGGIIGPVNTVTNGCAACATAPGIWQMNTVYDFVKNSDWVYNFTDQDYMVVAGGGGGGGNTGAAGGGGGGGGYRTSYANPCAAAISLKWGSSYPITVGAGGVGGISTPAPAGGPVAPTSGVDSTFQTITSAGGGAGGSCSNYGTPGGSGGGGGQGPFACGIGSYYNGPGCAGQGNSPTAPTALGGPQGNAGGTGWLTYWTPSGNTNMQGGGGGGANAVGADASAPIPNLSPGGAGKANSITGSPVTYAGGGGGGNGRQGPLSPTGGSPGGAGGGGKGGWCGDGAGATPCAEGVDGTENLGGGGGGQGNGPAGAPPGRGKGGGGGKGIVIVRLPSAVPVAVSPGCNSVATCVGPANDKVATFNVSGTLTL